MPVLYREMGMEFGTPYALTISKDWKKDSASSTRIELRASDPAAQFGGKRAEYTVINNTSNPDTRVRWYKFSTFQRASDWKPDTREKIFPFQFHDRSGHRSDGRCSASPSLAMEIINNRFRVQVRWSDKDYCTYRESRQGKTFDLIPVPFDKTNDWVIYYDPRSDAQGRVKIWLNNELIFDYTGPCHFMGSTFPYFKLGLYAWIWSQPVPSGLPTSHIGYIDALSIGGMNEDWSPVKPPTMQIKEMSSRYLYATATGNIVSYEWRVDNKLYGQAQNVFVMGEVGTSVTYACTATDDKGNKVTTFHKVTF